MKQKLFYALLSVVVIFGCGSAATAQNTVDTLSVEGTEVVDADAISVLSSKIEHVHGKVESLYQLQEDRLSNIEQRVANVQRSRNNDFDVNNVIPLVAIVSGCMTCILIISFKSRFSYLESVKRYELKKLQIERAEYLPAPMQLEKTEMSMTRFIRRLMVTGIVVFFILAWIALMNISSYSGVGFFETLMYMALLGGVGYSVVHLFKLYVQRRDEDK